MISITECTETKSEILQTSFQFAVL